MADAARVVVTGGNGCIGSVTVRDLLALGAAHVTVASRSGTPGLLTHWLRDVDDPRLEYAPIDVADREAVHALVTASKPTHIIHLGALQSPDCDADPALGLRVNVGGTLHVLEAAANTASVRRVVFASSAAVYGLRDRYPTPSVPEDAPLMPPNLYGVWKLAGEQLARQFHERTGTPTVCLRLNTTYGKGRDRGMTSAPTRALKTVALAAVRREPSRFRMPYGGRENYHFVEDVGAHFAHCTVDRFEGFGAFNIRGETIAVAEYLREVERVADELACSDLVDLAIANDATDNPFVCDLDEASIRREFGDLAKSPIPDGVRASIDAFREMAERQSLSL